MIKITFSILAKGFVSLSLVGVSTSFAADIPKNHCAVVVASRQTMDEVNEYAEEHGFVKESVTVYPSTNGWLAIGVDVILEETATPTLTMLKSKGKIPDDSYCTKGNKFENGIPLVAKNTSKASEYLFNDGRCALVVASRQTIEEVKAYITENNLSHDKTRVYPTESGWFAIGIDIINLANKKNVLAKLKEQNKIPADSYCSKGKKYKPALKNIFPPKATVSTTKQEPQKEAQQLDKPKADVTAKPKPVVKPKPKYAFKGHLSDGLAAVNKGGKWGYVDQQGKEVIPPTFDSALPFNVGVGVVGQGGKYALINTSGAQLTDFDFSTIGVFQDGIAIAKKDNNVGVLNTKGKVVLPFKFESIAEFNNGVAIAVKDGEKVFLNKNGDINSDYDYVGMFREGLAPFSKSERWGFLNNLGVVVIEPQFEFADAFHNGTAKVKKAGKYGYVNLQGKLVIPAQFNYVESFEKTKKVSKNKEN